ncbi:MAG: alkaline phosphatase D family protein [Acidimicrobiia bacterium]|jgi:alkaline phosphatase D
MVADPVFRYGVASGDPLSDRVMLWTHVDAPGPVTVEWTVALDEDLHDIVASGSVEASTEAGGAVHVDVTGLEPGTTYHYGFRALDETSPVGRTRTLPDPADHVRFAMVSCAKFNAGFFNAYARIADRTDLDFLLHLGDYIYEASNTPPKSQTPGADLGRPFDPLHECVTLDDYRTRYRQYRLDPDVQRLHAAHPVIATLDDHELADGAWRDGAAEHRPEYGPWSQRRANAFRAREEWLPIRRVDPADPERVWRRVPVGDLADLFLIDTRTRRDEPQPGPAMDDPARSALGAEQRAWLLQGLADSRARWRLLANPSVMGQTWNPVLPDDVRGALRKVKLLADDMQGPDFDQWDGYPVERDALFEHVIDHGMDNLVVLSGDVHVSLALELHRRPFEATDRPLAVEFVTPSLTSQNLDDKMGWPRRGPDSRAVEARAVEFLPHWEWVDLDSHGYVVVDVTAERVTAEWWHLDTVLERSPTEECGAVFSVPHGTPRLERLDRADPESGVAQEPAAG